MPIGTSDGQYFEDETAYHTDQLDPILSTQPPEDPFERAAQRTKTSVKPAIGKEEGPITKGISAIVPNLLHQLMVGPRLLQGLDEGTIDPHSDEAVRMSFEAAMTYGLKPSNLSKGASMPEAPLKSSPPVSLEQVPWTEADQAGLTQPHSWTEEDLIQFHKDVKELLTPVTKEDQAYNIIPIKDHPEDETTVVMQKIKEQMEATAKEWGNKYPVVEKKFNPLDSSSWKPGEFAAKYEEYLKNKQTPLENLSMAFHNALEPVADKIDASIAKLKSKFKNYESKLEPINWEDVKIEGEGSGYLPLQTVNKAKGEELGFNFNAPLIKGGEGQYPAKIPDPSKKTHEPGFFMTDKYKIAESYGEPLTYVARPTNAHMVDWKEATGYSNYNGHDMDVLIKIARDQKKADMLVVKNIHDIGGYQNQYVVIDPSILRAPHAKFDPEKLHVNNVLMGIGGAAAIPAAVYSMPSDEQ